MVAKWKREQIADHKFDYIDVDDFLDNSFLSRLRYLWIFLLTLKSILVYMADIGILIIMITAANELYQLLAGDANAKCDVQRYGPALCAESFDSLNNVGGSVSTLIPIPVRLGIVFGSMFFSFLFLAIEWRKGRRIIKSRDISYALTSTVAYRYYSIQSFSHFCFFQKIQNSRKTLDILAFFVFFRFKSWKRLLLAEFPRILIYALFLWDVLRAQMLSLKGTYTNDAVKFVTAIETWFRTNREQRPDILAQYSLMAFTVCIWMISFVALIIAFIIYIPLLSKIRGNLKEYVCHKIDKRIDEILRKKSRKRTEAARRAELEELSNNNGGGQQAQYTPWTDDTSSFSSYNNNGMIGGYKAPPPMGMNVGPTLPSVSVDDTMSQYSYGSAAYGGYPQQYQMAQPMPRQYHHQVAPRAFSDTTSIPESQRHLVGPTTTTPSPVPHMPSKPPSREGYY